MNKTYLDGKTLVEKMLELEELVKSFLTNVDPAAVAAIVKSVDDLKTSLGNYATLGALNLVDKDLAAAKLLIAGKAADAEFKLTQADIVTLTANLDNLVKTVNALNGTKNRGHFATIVELNALAEPKQDEFAWVGTAGNWKVYVYENGAWAPTGGTSSHVSGYDPAELQAVKDAAMLLTTRVTAAETIGNDALAKGTAAAAAAAAADAKAAAAAATAATADGKAAAAAAEAKKANDAIAGLAGGPFVIDGKHKLGTLIKDAATTGTVEDATQNWISNNNNAVPGFHVKVKGYHFNFITNGHQVVGDIMVPGAAELVGADDSFGAAWGNTLGLRINIRFRYISIAASGSKPKIYDTTYGANSDEKNYISHVNISDEGLETVDQLISHYTHHIAEEA